MIIICSLRVILFLSVLNLQTYNRRASLRTWKFLLASSREKMTTTLMRMNHENIRNNIIDNRHITMEILTGKRVRK